MNEVNRISNWRMAAGRGTGRWRGDCQRWRLGQRQFGRRSRGAFAVVAVIVVFVVAVMLFGAWTQTIFRQRLHIESRQMRIQAARLAESGIRRAVARRASDADYAGETWSIPAGTIGNGSAATVRIELTSSADGGAITIEAVAEYPAAAVRRARSTKHLRIIKSTPGAEP